MTPITHVPQPLPRGKIIGQRLIMLNLQNGSISDFLTLKAPDPTFRPMGVKFNEKEGTLYIISAGKVEARNTLPNGTPLSMPTPWDMRIQAKYGR
jgi:hypothetical protein